MSFVTRYWLQLIIFILSVSVVFVVIADRHQRAEIIVASDHQDINASSDTWKIVSTSLIAAFSDPRIVNLMATSIVDQLYALKGAGPIMNSEQTIAYLNNIFGVDAQSNEAEGLVQGFTQIFYTQARNTLGPLAYYEKRLPSKFKFIFERDTNSSYKLTLIFDGDPKLYPVLGFVILYGIQKGIEEYNRTLILKFRKEFDQNKALIVDRFAEVIEKFKTERAAAYLAMQEFDNMRAKYWAQFFKMIKDKTLLKNLPKTSFDDILNNQLTMGLVQNSYIVEDEISNLCKFAHNFEQIQGSTKSMLNCDDIRISFQEKFKIYQGEWFYLVNQISGLKNQVQNLESRVLFGDQSKIPNLYLDRDELFSVHSNYFAVSQKFAVSLYAPMLLIIGIALVLIGFKWVR